MDKEHIEEITITNAATNFPDVDVFAVRDYMTGRTPEIKCKECKFKAAPLTGSTYCNKQKRIVYASGCNYGELKRITNADKIRHMTDDELAEWLFRVQMFIFKSICDAFGYTEYDEKKMEHWDNILEWLRQEAK